MNKKTMLAGLVFAGLAAAAALVLRKPEKGTRSGDGPRPIPSLAGGAFDTLVVRKGDNETTVVRSGGTFRVTSPVDDAADADVAREAFEALEKLTFGSIVTDQKAKHAELEVSDAAVRVTARKGDQVLADLRIGKTSSGMTMVRLEGKDEVWQAQGMLQYKFDREPSAWRDKVIFKFDEDKATRLEVVARDGSRVVLEKPEAAPAPEGGDSAPPAHREWVVKDASLKLDNLDKNVPVGMIGALYAFRATDFADGASAAETGLDNPALRISVTVGSDSYTLRIGNKKGEEDYYVQRDGSDRIYTVKKWSMERLLKRPIEFRDKTLCNLSEGEILEVSVVRKDGAFTLTRTGEGTEAWKLSKPAGTLDTSRMASILGTFSEWKASGMAEDTTPATTGLGKPLAIVTAKSKHRTTCTIKIGLATKDDQSYFVETQGRPEVFLVSKWTADRVMPKLDDLKKKS